MSDFTIEVNGIEKINLTKNSKKIKKNFLKGSGNKLYKDARKNTPTRDGTLRGAWDLNIGDNEVKVSNATKYATWVDQGTGLYGPLKKEITPRESPFLQFEIDNQIIRTFSVKGMKPREITTKTLDSYNKYAKRIFEVSIQDVESSKK